MSVEQAVEHVRLTLGHVKWARFLARLDRVNHNIRTRGIRSWNNRRDLVTGYAYNDFYDWDAYRTFDMVLAEDTTREWYNAETGAAQGLDPFWGWSALAYFMPLEYELGCNPTKLDRAEMIPIARHIAGVTF